MFSSESALLLATRDILDAIEEVEAFLLGFDEEKFLADARTHYAVERLIMKIGEAAGTVSDTDRLRYAAIPWSKMRGMRNQLSHGYQTVNYSIVWWTAVELLPILKAQLQEVVEREAFDPGAID
ncbi:MAG: HepT-like ribonuclease domain-containing protein [Caldilineaceae bacterium]